MNRTLVKKVSYDILIIGDLQVPPERNFRGFFIHFIIGIPKVSSANTPDPQKLF